MLTVGFRAQGLELVLKVKDLGFRVGVQGPRVLTRGPHQTKTRDWFISIKYPDPLKDPKNGTPPNMNPLPHWGSKGIIRVPFFGILFGGLGNANAAIQPEISSPFGPYVRIAQYTYTLQYALSV